MKTNKFIFTCLAIIFITTGCVTKSKYNELEALYKRCADDLNYTTSEKIEFENRNKDLKSEMATLKIQINNLKEDTTAMGRRIRIAERNLAKTKTDYDDLLKSFTDQNLNRSAEIATLMNTLEARQKELEEKEARLEELQNILAQKDAEVKALKDKVANALKGFEDHGLTVYEKNGKVYVSLDEKLLFASASWDIDSRGREALRELGKVLANEPNINVLIEGHTDNVPFRGTGNVKDNWDLSVMRATSVVKELLKNPDIDPQRITAAGRSEYLPIDSDDTKEARAKNRRTEIILTPNLDELFRIIEGR